MPRVSLVVFLLVASLSCQAVEFIKVPNDVRLGADEQVGLFWIDEDNVLYQSFRTEDLRRMEQKTFQTADIYRVPRQLRIYNVRTGQFREHGLSDRGALCFSRGNILYKKPAETGSRSKYVYGPLGQEKSSSFTEDVDQNGIRSFIRCSNPDVSQFPSFPSQIVPLLEEHGFVEVRVKKGRGGQILGYNEAELYLYKKGSSQPTLIAGYKPISAQNLLNRAPHYASWKGAYFNYTVGVQSSVPNYAWWLFPDGKTEKLAIPRGPWNEFTRTNAAFVPTKVGLLISIGHPNNKLVLLRGNLAHREPALSRPQFLFSGWIWRFATSPQGCRLAMLVGATSIPNTQPSTLNFVDLCKA